MYFKDFFEFCELMENIYRKITDVPQRPDYHAEGPVYVHSRLVRKQLDAAINQLKSLANDPNGAFSNIDTEFSEEDRNVLRLAAWLHDLGKGNATVQVDDKGEKTSWRDVDNVDVNKLKAPKHEMPWNFNPAAKELLQSPLWQSIANSANFEDKKDLWYVIKNHMSLGEVGFSKRLIKDSGIVDEHGKFKNTRRVKLLITFIFMDRLGRQGKKDPYDTVDAMNASAKKVANRRIKQSQPAPEGEREFVQMMLPRVAGKPEDHRLHIIRGAFKGKFGRDISDEELRSLM